MTRGIPDYYGGKCTGPGELTYVKDLTITSSYKDKAIVQRELYLIWIEIGKLQTHAALLIPGWTGINVTVHKKLVVVESTIGNLDTLDSPAADLETAYEVLCRECEIRDRLNLEAVACVSDQSIYAKAVEVYWKNKGCFINLLVMMGDFHLLMMLLDVIVSRFGTGLKELAV